MADAKLGALGLGWLPDTLGLILWAIIIGLAYLVYRLVRKREYVFAVLAGVPMLGLLWLPVSEYWQYREYMAKYEPAKAIFDKLCAEQSQPIIKRTVEDVEGVLLLKVRADASDNDWINQNWTSAGLPYEATASSGYAEYFLFDRAWVKRGGTENGQKDWRIVTSIGKGEKRGFQFVDIQSKDDNSRTRITIHEDNNARQKPFDGFQYRREITAQPAPQYAVTFEDNIDPALRKFWIAGTTVKVIDRKSNETIGQQSFWTFDTGFGDTTGSRLPWHTAAGSCPRHSNANKATHIFVDSILKAKEGDK